MSGKKRLTAVNEEKLKELYLVNKLSTYKVAERMNCSPSLIQYWLKKYEIPRRKGMAIDKSSLIKLYEKERMTTKQIGEIFSCAEWTVRYWLKKNGISIRHLDGEWRKCVTCSKVFYIRPHIAKTINHGVFCSRECFRKSDQYKPFGSFDPWNKGLTKKNDERVKNVASKLSSIFKSKYRPAWNKGLKGTHFSPQTEFNSSRLKKMWSDPDFRNKNRRNCLKSLYKKPNNLEKLLLKFIRNGKLPFIYVGDGKEVINGLCPDFISTDGTKRLIEVFGSAYHGGERSFVPVDWKRSYWGRKAFFKSYGYDCMVIWDYELEDADSLLVKIKKWENENFRSVGKDTIVYPTAKLVNVSNLELGENVTIGDFVFLNAGKRTILGDNSQLNAHSNIVGGGETLIGKDVTVGYGAVILSGTDTPKGTYMVDARSLSERAVIRGKIEIHDGAFIASQVIICVDEEHPNIGIGKDSVVGALSYVSKDVPPNVVGWGQPFKIMKKRFE